MLKRIHIHNYRTLVNFEWRPPMACVLTGINGVGKSALVEVLWLLQDVIVEGKLFEETGFPSTRTEWLEADQQTIELELGHDGEHFQYRIDYRLSERTIREELFAGGALLYRSDGGKVELFGNDEPSPTPRTTIPFDRRRSFIAALEERPDNRRIIMFRNLVGAIWAIKPDPMRLGAAAIEEAAYLKRDLSNFASWYRGRALEDPDAAVALRDDLKKAIQGFVQLRLEPVSPEIKDLRARFEFGGKTHELGWAKLSDGQRLLIALYGSFRFAFKQARFVVLDEVENYVAPSEIQPWFRAVSDAISESEKQLLVISHHPESINYLAGDEAWRMWRDPVGGYSRVGKLQPDLSVGETAYDLVKQGSQDA